MQFGGKMAAFKKLGFGVSIGMKAMTFWTGFKNSVLYLVIGEVQNLLKA